MASKPAAAAAIVFLILIFLAHLLRLVFRVQVVAGGVVIPLWMSVPGVVAAGGLALWLWRESRRQPSDAVGTAVMSNETHGEGDLP